MTTNEIIDELRSLGKESYKKVLINHGVPEPCFGAKIEDMKKIVKRVKVDHLLALALYDTGVYDAQYLAGLIADDPKMSKKDLRRWAEKATCPALSEYTVAWVAAGGKHGHDLALEWIDSKKESLASTGWSTLSGVVSITPDEELDLDELKALLKRVQTTIHSQPNRVKYCMNCFVIAVGSYVKSLKDEAIKTAEQMGKVNVDVGDTSCKIPDAADYIRMVESKGRLGKKRKSVKC